MLRLVQFEIPRLGRRVGLVSGADVVDLTAAQPEWRRILDLFAAARRANQTLAEMVSRENSSPKRQTLEYAALLAAAPGGEQPFLHPPIDHPDPHALFVTGTGLTHLGGMKSRDQMHGGQAAAAPQPEPQTDSARMFAMGLAGGKPAGDERGAAPEWFYKGNGFTVRGPNAALELPAFALDGGEEPEIAGVYVIDESGVSFRLGFTLANEWSDHATERINYLYLAPSKLRTCAIGPELVVGHDFQNIRLRCTVTRAGETLYDSGELFSGEEAMCHSLANCEDHHFKYPLNRQPGDVHVHFFGTSKLSFSTRKWRYQQGDQIRVEAPGFCEPLVNTVAAGDPELARPVRVRTL